VTRTVQCGEKEKKKEEKKREEKKEKKKKERERNKKLEKVCVYCVCERERELGRVPGLSSSKHGRVVKRLNKQGDNRRERENQTYHSRRGGGSRDEIREEVRTSRVFPRRVWKPHR